MNTNMEVFGICVPAWIILLFLVVVLLYIYGTWTYDTFKKIGIPGPKPWPLLGNLPQELYTGIFEFDKNMKKYGRVLGLYHLRTPAILTCDAALMRQIMVKEFSHFPNRRGAQLAELGPPFDKWLISLEDEEWKRIRTLMTPAFSSGKLRNMIEQVNTCATILVDSLANKSKKGDISVKDVFGAYTLDVIGRVSFGIEVDSQQNPDDILTKHIKDVFKPRIISILLFICFPKALRLVRKIPGNFFIAKDANKYFIDLTKRLVDERNQNETKLPDLLQLMMNAHNQNVSKAEAEEDKDIGFKFDASEITKQKGMTLEELTSQSTLFIFAGSDTTSSTLSFLCYNLALHPEIQDKVYQEIDHNVPDEAMVTQEMYNKLIYLDQCIQETLRMYPPGVRAERVCKQDIEINGIQFKKGMVVFNAIAGVHYDPEYWPDPTKFDPERFTADMKASRDPLTYIPFGFGPRNCVGMRLAQMEIRIAMVKILQNFKISTCDKTEIPLKMKMGSLLQTKNPIQLKLEQRKKTN